MPVGLEEGRTVVVQTSVEEAMTAARFAKEDGEAYPRVLATPVLVGEMERACAALMAPVLAPGQMSVGARIEVSHQAPTPVGATLTTHATFVGREGALFWFEVWADDPGGTVGRGRHARAVVARETIERHAAERAFVPQQGAA